MELYTNCKVIIQTHSSNICIDIGTGGVLKAYVPPYFLGGITFMIKIPMPMVCYLSIVQLVALAATTALELTPLLYAI